MQQFPIDFFSLISSGRKKSCSWLILIWLARPLVRGLWLYIIKLHIPRNFRLVRLFSLSVVEVFSPFHFHYLSSVSHRLHTEARYVPRKLVWPCAQTPQLRSARMRRKNICIVHSHPDERDVCTDKTCG